MGQALYRKYRSTSLSEIVGQEHITTTLQTAIDTDRVSHAYLFTGPRGTGKTSVARILALAINDLPYSTDPHLDIIEIDAASNRRIDEIRDLRDKVYIAPSSAKYKVYIIDEVHMLTREAFNALLKTLEEPPAHVVFILATTDAHKLPETIVSRTQRYNFRPVDLDKVSGHLASIANNEKISIDHEALSLLAAYGQGSFRDSISMLDQVRHHGGKITADAVRAQLGIPPESGLQDVLDSFQAADVATPVMALQKLYDEGYRATAIAEQLSLLLRRKLAAGSDALSGGDIIQLLKSLLDVAGSPNPERYLEIVLMQCITGLPASPATSNSAPTAATSVKTKTKKEYAGNDDKPKADKPKPEPAETAATRTFKKAATGQQMTDEQWQETLSALKKQYNTIYGIVRMARTDFSEPGKVSLSFTFAFHQKRITDAKNRKIVTDTLEQVMGEPIELVCVLATETVAPTKLPNTEKALEDINSVFGGGELL